MRLAGEPSVSGKEYFISDLVEHCLHMVTLKRKWFLFGLIYLLFFFFNISYQSYSTTVFSTPGGASSHHCPPPCRMVKGRREILWDPFSEVQHPKCLWCSSWRDPGDNWEHLSDTDDKWWWDDEKMSWWEKIWHHWLSGQGRQWLNGHGFGQALGVGDGQGSPACYSPWGYKESDTTEQLNWTDEK